MRRARAALQRARLAHGLGGICSSRLVASAASVPPRARLSTSVPVPFALSAAALLHAGRGFASSGACRVVRKLRRPQPCVDVPGLARRAQACKGHLTPPG